MKTLFRLAILLLFANAMFHFVPPYWHHQQFQRELKDISQQWGEPTNEEVMQYVLATAEKHKVPITGEQVSLQRGNGHILIELAYEVPIQWVPSVRRPWPFTTRLDVWRLEPPTTKRK